MKLSRKSEYAILALIALAENYNKGLIKIADISDLKNIPQKYLEQILLLLKGTGYVRSIRGSSGGYSLAKPPGKICIAEIVRLIDGPIAPVGSVSKFFYEKTPISQNKKLLSIFKEIRDYVSDKMENTYISDLI